MERFSRERDNDVQATVVKVNTFLAIVFSSSVVLFFTMAPCDDLAGGGVGMALKIKLCIFPAKRN